jgi:hypothetical protein
MSVELASTIMEVSHDNIKVMIARKNVRESDKSGVDGRSDSDSDEDEDGALVTKERRGCVDGGRIVECRLSAEVMCMELDSGRTGLNPPVGAEAFDEATDSTTEGPRD